MGTRIKDFPDGAFLEYDNGQFDEGFQVRAMHYLVKPFAEEELERLTDEMLERIPHPDKYINRMELDAHHWIEIIFLNFRLLPAYMAWTEYIRIM